jgi:hypothetical protein
LSGAGSEVDGNAPSSIRGYINGVDASSSTSLTLSSSSNPSTLGLRITPSNLNFGKHRIQKSYIKAVTLKAIYLGHGKAPIGAALNSVTLSLSNQEGTAFSLVKTTCGSDLPIGESCKQWVVFNPASAGNYQGTLSATASNSSNSASVDLTGLLTAPFALFDN